MRSEVEKIGQELDHLARRALGWAEELGADEAKVGTSWGLERRVVAENGHLTLMNSLESRGFGLSVHKDYKKGSASTNLVSDEDVKESVTAAIDLASFSIPDPGLCYASPELARPAPPLEFLFSDPLSETSAQVLQSLMSEMLEVAAAEPKVHIDRLELDLSVSRESMLNSLGVHQTEMQTMIHWSYLGMARDGDQVSGMDYDSGFSFSQGDLADKIRNDLRAFLSRVVGNLNPVKCPDYKGVVLLSPRVVEQLIVGNLLYHASGYSIMDGKSRWADKLGAQVCSDKISIKDLPHDPRFMGATAYDQDGVPTQAMPLIDHGVLKTQMFDCYTAKKMDKTVTGIAGGPFSLVCSAGSMPLREMKGLAQTLLYVDRFSGNADPLTGDFSGVAKTSRLIKGGEDVGPVVETMIAGNVFDLANQLVAASEETQLVSGSFESPTFACDGVSVSS